VVEVVVPRIVVSGIVVSGIVVSGIVVTTHQGLLAGTDSCPRSLPRVPDLASLCDDLAAEHAVLDALVAGLDDPGWQRPTPAAGWTIRDQIAHLAFADERAALAVADPAEFARRRDADQADRAAFARSMAGQTIGPTGPDALAHWRLRRAEFLHAVRHVDPSARIPWYGPSMSPASKVTARIMETWAHGQDVADALEVSVEPTDRLRHVAHIGVGARPFSYRANDLPPDDTPVWVELRGPSGAIWVWGDDRAAERITGDALDFCRVVTRRRHVDQTHLVVDGAAASAWMRIAQAFAGPPGPTRPR
jgi:uncharacterized protein (TIGR03084 family)